MDGEEANECSLLIMLGTSIYTTVRRESPEGLAWRLAVELLKEAREHKL